MPDVYAAGTYVLEVGNNRAALFRLQVPLVLARGLYERLSDEELRDHYYDVCAEVERRGDHVLG